MGILDTARELMRQSPLNLSGTAKALSGLSFEGGSGGQGWNLPFWPSTRTNYAQELNAGQWYEGLRNLTLIQAAVNWVARGLISAPLKVVEIGSDEKETVVQEHELSARFAAPNDFYSRAVMLAGVAVSTVIAGEAYLLKVRSQFGGDFGAPQGLWWEPHWTIRPRWPLSGGQFISHYEYERNGIWYPVDPKDVIVIRREIDPKTRRGFSAVMSLLEEFYTDVRGARFAAQLFKQGLVPPLIIGLGTDKNPFKGSDVERRAFAEDMKRKTRGDKAGEPMVVPGGFAVEKLAFDYSKLGLGDVRRIPEDRFCAVMGISPHSLHLGAAREASTYNNVDGYLRSDYRNYIKPLHDLIAEQLTKDLLPDYGDPSGLTIRFDYTDVPEMQADKMADTKRSAVLYLSGGIDRAEYREANGYKMRPEDKDLYFQGAPLSPGIGVGSLTETKGFFDFINQDDLDSGGRWWARNAPREARGLLPKSTEETVS